MQTEIPLTGDDVYEPTGEPILRADDARLDWLRYRGKALRQSPECYGDAWAFEQAFVADGICRFSHAGRTFLIREGSAHFMTFPTTTPYTGV